MFKIEEKQPLKGQMPLPFMLDRESLEYCLQRKTGWKVSLQITDNVSSVLSYTKKRGVISLRLHHMFLRADEDVLDEVSRYIKTGKARTPILNKFIREHRHLLRELPPKPPKPMPIGKHFDLQALFDSLNAEYFQSRLKCSITWGRRQKKRQVVRRTLGSYSSQTNAITISPTLDRPDVPRYFLEFVVYHEMLHAALGETTLNGKRSLHTREFKHREMMFKHYDRALKFEKRGVA